MTNRCHKKFERVETWPFMLAFLDMIKPKQLVAMLGLRWKDWNSL